MKSPAAIGFPGGLIGSRLCFGFGRSCIKLLMSPQTTTRM